MEQIHNMFNTILLNAIKLYAGVHKVYPPDTQIAKWKNRLGIYWKVSYRG